MLLAVLPSALQQKSLFTWRYVLGLPRVIRGQIMPVNFNAPLNMLPHSPLSCCPGRFCTSLGKGQSPLCAASEIRYGSMQVFIYHTAALTIGIMAPLMVASFSILGMLIGLQYLEVEELSQNKKKN
ncbi:hypothetical protein EK904_009685 [Melospiza melodia maxima]|nr:hypothetical protein EK904_009685 [Melospiza melodia maxima]